MPPVILGVGGLLRDSACSILKDGRIASAVEQAKVARQDKHGAFPEEAFKQALEVARVRPQELDCIAVAHPFATGPDGASRLEHLRARFPDSEVVVVEHHHAHAASAFYVSPFEEATVLSMDRAGDFRSTVLFEGERNRLTPVRELYFPDSFGDVFNRVTELLGFEPRADEHKVQWLSVFGKPTYAGVFRQLLGAGKCRVQMDRRYFDSDKLTQGGFSQRFYDETGLSAGTTLSSEVKADLAASLQSAVTETVIHLAGEAQSVCMAGGVAFNALLIRAMEEKLKRVFVQPAAGNAGTALGAALYAWHNFYGETARVPFETLSLGPSYSPEQIKQVLENCKLRFRFLLTEGELIERAVCALNENKIVGWMQGRMEFGPRALGNRSILASPLNPYSTENLNVYIKHRESFRKFAASVPQEVAERYFETGPNARFLATVGRVKPEHRDTFAAAILGGDLIRVHSVSKEENPRYHALLMAAGESTGLPVLYNTSFNLFGDPLVCTPRDAVRSFYSSGIDTLFVGSFWLEK